MCNLNNTYFNSKMFLQKQRDWGNINFYEVFFMTPFMPPTIDVHIHTSWSFYGLCNIIRDSIIMNHALTDIHLKVVINS